MIEVEIKLPIENESAIAQKLLENDFKRAGKVRETDIYFNGIDRDFRQSDEAMRIRKTESLDGSYLIADYDDLANQMPNEIYQLTYKGPKLDHVSMARKEIELQISDFESMKNILISLGFKPVLPVVKEREEFFGEDMNACLDHVEGLGWFLELEMIVESEKQREAALQAIEKQLEKLGYRMDDTTRVSYLSMLEKKQG